MNENGDKAGISTRQDTTNAKLTVGPVGSPSLFALPFLVKANLAPVRRVGVQRKDASLHRIL
jgi:hypothetical protein